MTDSPDGSDNAEVLRTNLREVFGERDGERRRRAIDRLYGDDVRFTDPEGTVTGRAALFDKVQGILDGAPDHFTFVEESSGAAGDLGLLRWAFGPPDAPPVVRGTDVALVAEGRIVTLYTILDGQ